jgi:NAD(P)-dependent dehydrogenase (short-subunit alcohol dehydrogenase family)
VIIGGRTADAACEAASRLCASGGDAHWVELDVTSQTSVQSAASEIVRRHGRLDLLVNNAGILPEATAGAAHQFSNADIFRRTFETNVFGAVAVTEAFLPLLRESDEGRIVNISSTMGSLNDQTDLESPYYSVVVPAYQASKAALNSVTIGLSKLLAGTGVSAVSVCPGFVQTDLTPANRSQAPLTAERAAEDVLAAAFASGVSSGSFVGASGAIAW